MSLSKRHWDSSCRRHANNRSNGNSSFSATPKGSNASVNFTPVYKDRNPPSFNGKRAIAGVHRTAKVDNADTSDESPLEFSLNITSDDDTKGLDLDHTSVHDAVTMQKDIFGSNYSSVPHDIETDAPATSASIINPISLSNAVTTVPFIPKHQFDRFQCAFTGSRKGDNRIAIPIHLNGVEFTALLDTGCTQSTVDPRVAKELCLPVEHLQEFNTTLANPKHKVPTMITTQAVQVRCNGRSLTTQLDVMELDNYDCYLGMDLISRFGFTISGFQLLKTALTTVFVEVDQKPSIVAPLRPAHESSQEFREQRRDFLAAIEAHLADNAAIDPKSFCPHPFMKVHLSIQDGEAVLQRSSRPFSQSQKGDVDDQIANWLNEGVIVLAPHGTPHMNKLTMAARHDLDGNLLKHRVCLDPRHLNSLLKSSDNFILPMVFEILEKAAGHRLFTTLDLRQAYHRLPLSEESQPLTAFMHDGKQYMFARAPFGLKPMTSIFQRGMSLILGDLSFVAVYVDDIVIFSDTAEEHREHVREVIKRLTASNLILNPDKCNFFSTEVILLGFIINEFGRRIVPEKVANIQSWAPPTNGKMVQRYLGMFNYFREFIPLYSTLAAPLDELRFHKGHFVLSPLQLECFTQIKHLISCAPVLSFADFSSPFYVATDASNLGVGTVLYQLPKGQDDESEVRYISFMARSLKKHERNYPAYKKELLGIVYALKKFHYYLWGRHFKLYTDHKPLTFIQHQTDLPTTIANWTETILSHDFECIYRPGLLNIIPDALSRAFPDELWASPPEISSEHRDKRRKIAAVSTRRGFRTSSSTASEPLPEISSEQLGASLSNPSAPFVHRMQLPDDTMANPAESRRPDLLQKTHGDAHLGANAMVNALHLQKLTWPKLKDACLEFIRKCPACQHFNIARRGYHPLKAIHAAFPGEHLAMDLAQFPLSARNNVYALIVVDVCTRFVFLRPIKTKEASVIATELFKLFSDIGPPKIIQSDNGTEFSNSLLSSVLAILKTEHRLSTPYHPRGNGVAERTVRSVKDLLPKVLNGKILDWDVHLPAVQLSLNTKVASLHSSIPFSLFYGRAFSSVSNFEEVKSELLTPADLDDRIAYLTNIVFPAISAKSKASQKQMIDKFNRSHHLTEFPVGSFVMIKDMEATGSLDALYNGPFKVVARTSHGTYTLRDTTNSLLPRNFAPEQMKLALQAEVDDQSYEVEKIIGHRNISPGETVHLVKW